MFATDDTIAAIATPLGRSGIGVIRLSGPEAANVAAILLNRSEPLEPRRATFARLAGPLTSVSDQVVATLFAAPNSYTGENVVEISAHGSPVVLQAILRATTLAGARLAEPGEFTLRAFLNGKIDLIQAEAVADLIDAVTPLQARAAFDQLEGTLTSAIAAVETRLFELRARLEASLDFPEEGYHFIDRDTAASEIATLRDQIGVLLAKASRGRMIREGANVAIVGTPNVGKSSVFNALLNANRAIVTAIPGTTRDLLTERADVEGFAIALVDTAGVRDSNDEIEREGIARARQARGVADVTLLVLDRSRPLSTDDEQLLTEVPADRRIVVLNKIDLPAAFDPARFAQRVDMSAATGEGLASLSAQIAAALGSDGESRDAALVTNTRHVALLESASGALERALAALKDSANEISEEFILSDLQLAADRLQEVTGRRTTDDLLRHIFERFCIGK